MSNFSFPFYFRNPIFLYKNNLNNKKIYNNDLQKNKISQNNLHLQENKQINYYTEKLESNMSNYLNNYINESKKNSSSFNEEEPFIFELFGLKLYFDDILILCLIYFLYIENIKDEWLIIVLLLLLFN